MAEHPSVTVVVDLDGTLYRGNGPVLVYATELAAGLTPSAGDALLRDLQAYFDGTGDPELTAASDAWVAARLAAARYGVSEQVIQPAFLAARLALGDGSCAVEPATALIDALTAMAGRAYRVLATNSPPDGLPQFLRRLGAEATFDRLLTSARKPGGLQQMLPELVAQLPSAHRLASVGDHWVNDLAPALALGAVTFYIDPFDTREGPAHVRGRTAEDLIPALLAWSEDPDGFLAAHPLPAASRRTSTH